MEEQFLKRKEFLHHIPNMTNSLHCIVSAAMIHSSALISLSLSSLVWSPTMECASLVSTHQSGSSLTWEPYWLGGCVNNLNLRVIFSCLETSQLFNKPAICVLANHKFLKICKLICRLILKMFLFAEITTIDNKNKYYCYYYSQRTKIFH